MTYTPHLIANNRIALDREVDPWLLPEAAFDEFNNAYLQRGVINKRDGYEFFAQMTHATTLIIGATQANPVVITSIAHGLLTGQSIVINGVGGMTQLNGREYTVTVLTANTFRLDGVNGTAYGAYTAGGYIGIFSTDPIMGIANYIQADGSKQLLVFDTKRMGIYNPTYNLILPYAFTNIFSGDDSDFFWTENYRSSNTITDNKLYITNNVDAVYTWNGAVLTDFTATMQYGANPADVVNRCKFIFAFKQRLVLLSTEENGTLRAQRARWSQAQNPTQWSEIVPGKGGFVDAPTGEFIISAAFLKDILIVQFTNSWWMLRPNSDPALPFRWDKITSNRSVNAPFGTASYDRVVTGIGNSGIIECNGVEVQRIDEKIPTFVIDEINQKEFDKVFTTRYLQGYQTWTLYPDLENDTSNKVLVLNEQDASWSTFDIPLSCLGTSETTIDQAWKDYKLTASDATATLPPLVWVAQPASAQEDFGETRWLAATLQANTPLFLGGGHDGIVYQLSSGMEDNGNAIAMELITAEWNPYKDQGIACQLGYIDFLVDADPQSRLLIEMSTNNSFGVYKTQQINFLPQQNFVADVDGVSQANPAIVTAEDHGLQTGDTIFLYQIEGTDELNGGQYVVTVIDQETFSLNDTDSSAMSPYVTGGIIMKGEFQQDKVWKRIYAGAIGFSHQLRITNEASNEPIRIHAIMPWFRPAGNRVIGL